MPLHCGPQPQMLALLPPRTVTAQGAPNPAQDLQSWSKRAILTLTFFLEADPSLLPPTHCAVDKLDVAMPPSYHPSTSPQPSSSKISTCTNRRASPTCLTRYDASREKT